MLITLNIGFCFLFAELSVWTAAIQDDHEAFFKKLVVTVENGLLKNPDLTNRKLVRKIGPQLDKIPVPKDYFWGLIVFDNTSKAIYDMDPKFPAEKTTTIGKPKAFVRYRLGFGGRNYYLVAGPKFKAEDKTKIQAVTNVIDDDCKGSVKDVKSFARKIKLKYKLFFCAQGNAANTYMFNAAYVAAQFYEGTAYSFVF